MEIEIAREKFFEITAECKRLRDDMGANADREEAARLAQIENKLQQVKRPLMEAGSGGRREAEARRRARDGLRERIAFITGKMDNLQQQVEAAP